MRTLTPSTVHRRNLAGRRPRRRATVVLVVVLALLGFTLDRAVAGPSSLRRESSAAEEPAAEAPSASLAPELAEVKVDSWEYRKAKERADTTALRLKETRTTREKAEQVIADGRREDEELSNEIAAQSEKRRAAKETIDRINGMLRELAIAGYVHDPEGGGGASMLAEPNAKAEGAGTQVVFRRVTDDQIAELAVALADYDAANQAIDAATSRKREVRAKIVASTATRVESEQAEERLEKALENDEATLENARALARVVGADFPLVALDAYWKAAHAHVEQGTNCGIPWWGLAGVGRIETGHGTSGGSTLRANGATSRPIIGIALDGSNNTSHVADSDGGRLDGDSNVDRAVGPMQFIPSTWERWARDGNGDGAADPHNLYDAARTAASFLCQGGPLTSEGALRDAYLRYNSSDAYAEEALGYARGYASLQVPSP